MADVMMSGERIEEFKQQAAEHFCPYSRQTIESIL